MKPKGKDVAEAIKKWMEEEIKSSPSRTYELGRFLFTVSIGSIGLFTAIEKTSANPAFNCCFELSLILLSLSILVSLNMARPRNWKLDGETDLFDEYKLIINRGIRHTVIWLLVWAVGFGFGLYNIIVR